MTVGKPKNEAGWKREPAVESIECRGEVQEKRGDSETLNPVLSVRDSLKSRELSDERNPDRLPFCFDWVTDIRRSSTL